MEKMLYLVRGLPSSGKSTFAKTLGGKHVEADMYFIDENGDYKFDGSKIKLAHEWCKISCIAWMGSNEEKIVVSNTFTQEWEMEPYFELAKKYGYKVFSIVIENRHGNKNKHDVPEDKVQMMRDRFEIKI
jgi:predicted kinase